MTQHTPKFQEEYSAKLPALTLLTNLGWSFLSPDQALSAHGGKTDELVLRQFVKHLFIYAGKRRAKIEEAA
jgi:type I restriction enzyme R subunit